MSAGMPCESRINIHATVAIVAIQTRVADMFCDARNQHVNAITESDMPNDSLNTSRFQIPKRG